MAIAFFRHSMCCGFVNCMLGLVLPTVGHAGGPPAEEDDAIQELGAGLYRVGSIEVDKNKGSFQVPGVVSGDC